MGKRLLWPIALFSIVTIILLALPLYGQIPTPSKGGDKPKSETQNKSEVSKTNQTPSKTLSSPKAFEVSPKTNVPTSNSANKHDDKSAGEWWLIAFTGALVCVGILQFIALWRQADWMRQQSEAVKHSIAIAKETTEATKIQTETMRKELVLTQRPKLRVRDIVIPDLRNQFPENKTPSGELRIVNIGGTPAKIINVGCWVEWLSGGLPMKKPYDGESPNCPNPISTKLQAGQSFLLKFADNRRTWERAWDDIFRGSGGIPLYVMGYVEYIDDIDTPRQTTFCREYRWPTGQIGELRKERRFFPVDDADYEHEE